MQILPGFFLHFSSNFAHLSHIHRLFLLFFLKFRPPIRNHHFSFWLILALFDSPKYKLIQFPEYLLLRRDTLRHACFPTLRSVQIPHYRCHFPLEIYLPSFQAIVGCCWRQLVPFSVFKFLINSLRVQAKREQVLQKRTRPCINSTLI
jgi:hypothetical protein